MDRRKGDERLGIAKLKARTGLSDSTIARRAKEGTFPKPHFIGANRMWWVSEIEAWEEVEQVRAAERAEAKRARFLAGAHRDPA